MKLSLSFIRRSFHYPKQFTRVNSATFSRKQHNLSTNVNDVKSPEKLSTLYVPGRRGADMYQIVRPIISADDISRSLDDIRKSCHLRGIDLELSNVVDLLRQLDSERSEFATFVERDRWFAEEMKRLDSIGDVAQLNCLKKDHEDFITTLKSAKEKLHDTEELVLPMIEKIPNLIHPCTPLESDTEDAGGFQYTQLSFDPKSHSEICKQDSLIKFLRNGTYYLKGALSELEMAIQIYLCARLTLSGYAAMSCADFCKSFLIEAVGQDPSSVIPVKMKVERGQMLHLVGGASLESFCAYLTNMNISKANLPARYFSFGRRYHAENCQRTSFDLFTVSQSSNIHCLTLCQNDESEEEEFETLVHIISSFYYDLCIPFRIVNCSPRNLNITENRRTRFEVWSPARQTYVVAAHVSGRGDFVSKRLHTTYGDEHVIEGYCHMVEGVVANIPTLIGCIVENFQKPNHTFHLPDELEFLEKLIKD